MSSAALPNGVAQHHLQAILLAAASSTDNFLVGLSVGLSGKPLPQHVLWGIAICNAAGCWVATAGGSVFLEWIIRTVLLGGTHEDSDTTETNSNTDATSNMLQYLLAAAAFGYLAFQEYQEQQQQKKEQGGEGAAKPASLSLALPMTLNNLAGGVTGGVMGLSPSLNTFYALVISVVTMWVGFIVGKSTRGNAPLPKNKNDKVNDYNNDKYNKTDTTKARSEWDVANLSIALYIVLSVQSLYDAIAAITSTTG